jgi:hypothetical protein
MVMPQNIVRIAAMLLLKPEFRGDRLQFFY